MQIFNLSSLKNHMKICKIQNKIEVLQQRMNNNKLALEQYREHFIVRPESTEKLFTDAIANYGKDILDCLKQIDDIQHQEEKEKLAAEKSDSFFMGTFLGCLLGIGVLATFVYFFT